MYELMQVSERCYYIQCPAKIGLFKTGEAEVCLIDSGNDKDAAKKVLKLLQAQGWQLQAIYHTHSHADHIGGSRHLQQQTGCKVYAPGMECAFTAHPILEPAFLYGGNPPKDLRHKFLMAQACDVLPLTPDCMPAGLTAVPLPGHAWDMVGYRSQDGTVFLADCLSSKETLEKYRIGYLVDVPAYLATLQAVQQMEAALFIPAHTEPCKEIAPLAQYNIDCVQEIAQSILSLCAQPLSFELLLRKLFAQYGLVMTLEQHALVGSTVRSYLAWLRDTGRIQVSVQNNMLLWQTCQ